LNKCLHISEDGFDYNSSNNYSSTVVPKSSSSNKKEFDSSFQDYYDAQNTKLNSLRAVNKSTENLKYSSMLKISSESLPFQRSMGKQNKYIEGKNGINGISRIDSSNYLKYNQKRMKMRMNKKLNELRGNQGRLGIYQRNFRNGIDSRLSLSPEKKNKIFATETSGHKKRFIAVIPDGSEKIEPSQFLKIEITQFLDKYVVRSNKNNDDFSEIQLAARIQQKFDKRAFLEFKNFVDKEFDKQLEQNKLLKNSNSGFTLQKSAFEEDNKLVLYTPGGKEIKEFKDIEGIYDTRKNNLGFLVASWNGYFIGLKAYDPHHGHLFKKDLKERQVRDNIRRLETEWQIKRNKYSSSNNEMRNKNKKNMKIQSTNYIWKNEGYRDRFQSQLGSMKPVHLYDPIDEQVITIT